MLRLLIWALLAYGLFRIVRRLLAPPRQPPAGNTGVLVQDKVCGAFVDRSRALSAAGSNGEVRYFCSEACRRKARKG